MIRALKENMYQKSITLILLLSLVPLYSQSGIEPTAIERAGQSGWQFLKINGDPRQASMGGVYLVNRYANANAVFGSPAILASIDRVDIQFNSVNWIADIKYNSFSMAKRFGRLGSFALSYVNLDYGDIPETIHEESQGSTTTPVITGNYFTASDVAIGLSFAKKITDYLSLGGNVRYISEKIAGTGMSNWSIDFSTLYYTGLNSLRISIIARNFGPDQHLVGYSEELQSEAVDIRMPLEFRIGVAYDFFENENNENYLTAVIEGKVQSDGAEKINIGAEYVIQEMFFIRAGYRFNYDSEGLTVGLGFNYLWGKQNMTINYALLDFQSLKLVHMISIGLNF
ncbi:MAG: PorV/PorQ family protein [Bacteroidales bacterium]|nr:PorV/PorQ family protein [Bacteroidales bacterium]